MLDRGLAQRPTSQHLEVKLACMVCDLTCKDRSINKPIYLSGLGALCRVRPTGEHQSVKHRCMVQDGVGLEQSPTTQAQQINLGYMVQDLRKGLQSKLSKSMLGGLCRTGEREYKQER